MIQASLTYNSKPIELLINYLDNYAEIVNEEFNKSYAEVEPQLLSELQYEPPLLNFPQDYPRLWSSEQERFAFFATDGFGGGIPHRRTHELVKAWLATKTGGGLNITVKIKNNNVAAIPVYGSLSKSNRGEGQTAMHVQGGWPQQGNTIDFWLDVLTKLLVDNMNQRLGDMVGSTKLQRRSYTSPRK